MWVRQNWPKKYSIFVIFKLRFILKFIAPFLKRHLSYVHVYKIFRYSRQVEFSVYLKRQDLQVGILAHKSPFQSLITIFAAPYLKRYLSYVYEIIFEETTERLNVSSYFKMQTSISFLMSDTGSQSCYPQAQNTNLEQLFPI